MSFNRKPEHKVNWIREHTCANGVVLRISDRTGIVQAVAGSGLGIQAYRDDFLMLFQAMIEVQQYLDQNQDKAFSADASREIRKAKQVQERNERKAIETLQNLDPSVLQKALETLTKKQA